MKVVFATSSYNQVCFMDNVHKIDSHELYLFIHSFIQFLMTDYVLQEG